MKEDRTAFWFRIRVILSTLLVLLGAGLFFAGYYGYAKKWGIPIEVSFFGSGGMIIAGFAIRATLFHCPFCGAHIYLRNPVLVYFYSCPSCGHSVGKGKASYLNRRLSTNSVHESKHSNVAHYRRKVITIIALLISWFICAILLYIFNLFNGYCGILLIISSIPILLSVWTLRCPKCGAWIAKQTPIWEFLHYNCKICGFSADESDKRE